MPKQHRISIADLPKNAKLDISEEELRNVSGGYYSIRPSSRRLRLPGLRASDLRMGFRQTTLKW